MARASCPTPTDCPAGKRGPCSRCHPQATSANAERMRKLNADPEFAATNAERTAERMRKLHADPEFAAAHAERMRKLNADPEFAAANAERMRKRHADRRGYEIPQWVRDADLVLDFTAVADAEDEIVAARHCRRLKTEAVA